MFQHRLTKLTAATVTSVRTCFPKARWIKNTKGFLFGQSWNNSFRGQDMHTMIMPGPTKERQGTESFDVFLAE